MKRKIIVKIIEFLKKILTSKTFYIILILILGMIFLQSFLEDNSNDEPSEVISKENKHYDMVTKNNEIVQNFLNYIKNELYLEASYFLHEDSDVDAKNVNYTSQNSYYITDYTKREDSLEIKVDIFKDNSQESREMIFYLTLKKPYKIIDIVE